MVISARPLTRLALGIYRRRFRNRSIVVGVLLTAIFFFNLRSLLPHRGADLFGRLHSGAPEESRSRTSRRSEPLIAAFFEFEVLRSRFGGLKALAIKSDHAER